MCVYILMWTGEHVHAGVHHVCLTRQEVDIQFLIFFEKGTAECEAHQIAWLAVQ